MGKLFTFVSALLISAGSVFAADPSGYEWWFDNDISLLQSGTLSEGKADLIIDTSQLPKGAHYFNCRLNTAEGVNGSIFRKMFYALGQDKGAISYEYWFDNDYSRKSTGDISSGTSSFEVDVTSLPTGAHYFNCRLSKGGEEWGSVYRRMIFTTPTGNDAVGYEYWLDDNYDARSGGALTAGANSYVVDLDGLRKGMHRFNYRMQTGDGDWGSIFTKYFYYSSSSTLPFTSYEYWLDNDYDNRVSGRATTNPVTFDIDLDGFDKSGPAHYFTLRVRDDDGDWSSFYHRLLVFHDGDKRTPVVGYRHYLNGTDLGYVKVERQITDKYTFLTELPDSMRLSVRDKKPVFDGDRISLEGTDSLHYVMHLQTELGWGAPQTWDLEVTNPFTTTAVAMGINTQHEFDTPGISQFAAACFQATSGETLYLRADEKIALDLYLDGEKVMEITAEELYGMKQLDLPSGEYYAIMRDADPSAAGKFTFHVMNTPNVVPNPEILFREGEVSIHQAREDAVTYYTIEDYLNPTPEIPTANSIRYDGVPFILDHNGVIRAISIVPDSDVEPSGVEQFVIEYYRVPQPEVSFEHLAVEITTPDIPGVKTFYTLNGKVPELTGESAFATGPEGLVAAEGTMEYTGRFSLTGNATVTARSYKVGYTPSELSTFTYTHSSYITGAPRITLEGTTVTLSATTAGSTLWYSIDNPDPSQMSAYTAPFTMDGNGTIYAQARKTDMYDSEVVEYVINGRQMPKPQIGYSANMVDITCAKDARIYYTLDESAPSADVAGSSSILYDGIPFEFDRNGVIKAIAVDVNGNLDNSDIAELVIDDHTVEKPSISFEHLQVVIRPDTRSGVKTFYTLSGRAPQVDEATLTAGEGTYEYTTPFSFMESGRVMARSYRNGYHPSELAEYAHSHESYIVGAPEIRVEGAVVAIVATTPGSTLWYSIGDADETAMQPYEGEITVNGNLTVYAQARKSDMYNSPIVSYQVTGQKAEMPAGKFDPESKLLTLTCQTAGNTIRYAINEAANWQTYTQPIRIEGNCVVYAKAEAPDYLESDVAEITVSEFKCQEARISYNGRYVVLATDEPDGEIRYTLDGSNPAAGETYASPFDAEGLGRVRAVVMKSDFMNSDEIELELTAYGDETHAETSKEGVLADAYEWAGEGYLDTLTRFRVEGRLGENDYYLIRTMKGLRHLDIEDVAEAAIPQSAFSGMRSLVSISMPKEINEIGDSILGSVYGLSAVIWNSETMNADARLLERVINPNLLLYLSSGCKADEDLGGVVTNIVTDYRAGVVRLTDGYPFNAPRGFTADDISYTRHFSKLTAIGDCGGWETLTLPFDVESIRDSESEIIPFASAGDDDRPFWLYSPVSTGWERAASISGYRPYLVAMPNNPDYIESFNIRGDVVFSARNASVEVTPEPEELIDEYLYRNGSHMVPVYERLESSDSRWVVNDEQDGGNLPGSVFIRNLRDVRPFECYIDYESTATRMPIFDSTDLETIMSELGTDIWCENHDLCILSGIGQRIRIFDTVGQLVRIAEVEAGVVCRVSDLTPGIYIVGKTKIMVR